MAELARAPILKFTDSSGNVYGPGYWVHTYVPGTDTLRSIYTDRDCLVAHPNPVEMPAGGELEAYFKLPVKLILKDASGVVIKGPYDNVGYEDRDYLEGNYVVSPNGTTGNSYAADPTLIPYEEWPFSSLFVTVGDVGYETFATAVTSLNASGTETLLVLPAGAHAVSGVNVTANSNICVYPLPGADIQVANGRVCTINNLSPATGAYKWITLSGTGVVTFGAGAVDFVRPEWWGDDTSAFNAAIVATPSYGSLMLVGGKTYSLGAITLKSLTKIVTVGNSISDHSVNPARLLYTEATGDFLSLNTGGGDAVGGVGFENVIVDGNATTGNAVNLGTWRSRITNCEIRNADTLINFASTSSWAGENTIWGTRLHKATTAIKASGSYSVDNEVSDCAIFPNGGTGTTAISVATGGGWNIHHNHIYGQWTTYINLTGNGTFSVNNNYIDSIGASGTGIQITQNGTVSGGQVQNNRITSLNNNSTGVHIVASSTGKVSCALNTLYFSSATGTVGIKTTGAATFYGDIHLNEVMGAGTDYSLHSGINTSFLEAIGGQLKTNATIVTLGKSGTAQEVKIISGFGMPEGVQTANAGSFYVAYALDGDVRQVFVKQSGTGNTGWMPVMVPLAVTAKGGDATGTNVFSTNANPLGANAGFITLFDKDGNTVYVPYWTTIAP